MAPGNWWVCIADRFHFSARAYAPAGSGKDEAVRAAIASLTLGPRADDSEFLLPPCVWKRCRRVAGADLVVVYSVAGRSIRVWAVAPAATVPAGILNLRVASANRSVGSDPAGCYEGTEA